MQFHLHREYLYWQKSNDELASIISKYPERFDGFAMVPSNLPDLAAKELDRAVKQLGLKGAMLHGLSAGEMVDESKFWPIFAKAEELGIENASTLRKQEILFAILKKVAEKERN